MRHELISAQLSLIKVWFTLGLSQSGLVIIFPTNETKFRAVNIMGDILSQLEGTDLETLEKTGKRRKHKKVISICENLSGRADSNGRPRRPERRALNQAELRPACCLNFQESPLYSVSFFNLPSFSQVC